MLSVRYNDRGFIRTQFLVYTPAMTQNPFTAGALNYTFTQRLLTLATTGTYYIRWTRSNGYQILPPYGDLPNDPWFPRIGFNINPWAPEWARQLFNPQPPYLLATWVPGKVLSPAIIEFERKRVFFAGGNYPDVLVFDKDYNLKYALVGALGKGPCSTTGSTTSSWRSTRCSRACRWQCPWTQQTSATASILTRSRISRLQPIWQGRRTHQGGVGRY